MTEDLIAIFQLVCCCTNHPGMPQKANESDMETERFFWHGKELVKKTRKILCSFIALIEHFMEWAVNLLWKAAFKSMILVTSINSLKMLCQESIELIKLD